MLTPRGAILLGASLALTALGFMHTDGVLITLGCCGYLVLAGAFAFSRINLRRLSISLRAPARIYAGQQFDLRLEAWSVSFHVDVVRSEAESHGCACGKAVSGLAPWSVVSSSWSSALIVKK